LFLDKFDVILCFGVLYHLRYPFWGLKKIVDCLEDKGLLIIESGMLVDRRLEDDDFLFCPVEQSPYEYSSCTFFNKSSLSTTLKTFGCKLLDHKTLNNQSESTVMNTMKRLKRAKGE